MIVFLSQLIISVTMKAIVMDSRYLYITVPQLHNIMNQIKTGKKLFSMYKYNDFSVV